MASAAKWMVTISNVSTPLPNLPPGVEASVRRGPHGIVYILVNLSKQAQTINLPSLMRDILEGSSKSSVNLPVYGVAVLAKRQ